MIVPQTNFQAYERPYVSKQISQLAELNTQLMKDYEIGETLHSDALDTVGLLEVADFDVDLKNEFAQKVNQDLGSLVSDYQGAYESRDFQRKSKALITKLVGGEEVRTLTENKKNADMYYEQLRTLGGEALDFAPVENFQSKVETVDADGNPVVKYQIFRPKVEKKLGWAEQQKKIVDYIKADTFSLGLRNTTGRDVAGYLKSGFVTRSDKKIDANLENILTTYKSSAEFKQQLDWYKTQAINNGFSETEAEDQAYRKIGDEITSTADMSKEYTEKVNYQPDVVAIEQGKAIAKAMENNKEVESKLDLVRNSEKTILTKDDLVIFTGGEVKDGVITAPAQNIQVNFASRKALQDYFGNSVTPEKLSNLELAYLELGDLHDSDNLISNFFDGRATNELIDIGREVLGLDPLPQTIEDIAKKNNVSVEDILNFSRVIEENPEIREKVETDQLVNFIINKRGGTMDFTVNTTGPNSTKIVTKNDLGLSEFAHVVDTQVIINQEDIDNGIFDNETERALKIAEKGKNAVYDPKLKRWTVNHKMPLYIYGDSELGLMQRRFDEDDLPASEKTSESRIRRDQRTRNTTIGNHLQMANIRLAGNEYAQLINLGSPNEAISTVSRDLGLIEQYSSAFDTNKINNLSSTDLQKLQQVGKKYNDAKDLLIKALQEGNTNEAERYNEQVYNLLTEASNIK